MFGTFLDPYSGVKIDGGTETNPVLTGSVIGDGSGGDSGINLNSTAYLTQASFQVTAVPEPTPIALALTGLGALGVVGLRRLRHRTKAASA